jgi:bifunctional DNA-binding transcriptional regulator/antitoxin component of YhaV-PrlF toxin-antitoxin module
MKIVFPTFLASQGRIYIPKAIVERFELWVGTPLTVMVLIRNYKRVQFPATVREGWMFTVPNRIRAFYSIRYKDPLQITLTKDP